MLIMYHVNFGTYESVFPKAADCSEGHDKSANAARRGAGEAPDSVVATQKQRDTSTKVQRKPSGVRPPGIFHVEG